MTNSRATQQPHILEVWGDFACFTRPEGKVERWSYPCPTPSSARGILDAIYAKPTEFRWQPTRIEILDKPPSRISIRRNEVKAVISTSKVAKWMSGSAPPEPLVVEDVRVQRQTMALRNPHYRIHARIVPRPGFERRQTAFDQQFLRRAQHGKCFHQPYFGCREFVAFFRLADGRGPDPCPHDEDIGFMVYDVFDLSRVNGSDARTFVSVFRAVIQSGVLEVPDWHDPAVLKPRAREDG